MAHAPDQATHETRHGAKAGDLAHRLTEAIRAGHYVPGQRLVEAELTASFAVSRGLVREAFRRLAAEGLIELVPNRGAVVRQMSYVEAAELFEIRAELEAMAARKAAQNIQAPEKRCAFETAITPIWRDANRHSTADYVEENRRFHTAIYEAAGNTQLSRLNHQLQLTLILGHITSAWNSDDIAHSIAEHREIANAILAGDAATADMAVRNHVGRAADMLARLPSTMFA